MPRVSKETCEDVKLLFGYAQALTLIQELKTCTGCSMDQGDHTCVGKVVTVYFKDKEDPLTGEMLFDQDISEVPCECFSCQLRS